MSNCLKDEHGRETPAREQRAEEDRKRRDSVARELSEIEYEAALDFETKGNAS